jgi:hypothetical protein
MTRTTQRKVKPERLNVICQFCAIPIRSTLDDIVTFPEPGHMIQSTKCPYCECSILFATDNDVVFLSYPKKHEVEKEDGSFFVETETAEWGELFYNYTKDMGKNEFDLFTNKNYRIGKA